MRIRSFAALVLITLIASCGSDQGTGTTPTIGKIVIADIQSAVNPGRTLQLVLFAFDPPGNLIQTPGTFVWASSTPSVATVTPTGLVSALTAGTTTISAARGGTTGTMQVTVTALTAATKDTIVTGPSFFSPPNLTISAGRSVTFVFGGGLEHNVIFKSSNPAGSPPDIQNATNLVFTRTFNARGTFAYDCTVHPGMTGQVVVQ